MRQAFDVEKYLELQSKNILDRVNKFDNKLYIENLDGNLKSIEIFNFSTKEFIDQNIEYTNDYIVTPSISGPYIFKLDAIYEGKPIEYYFMVNMWKNEFK